MFFVNTVLSIRKCFGGLSRFEAQQIIINITSILANGVTTCRDSALQLLTLISEEEPKKLLIFAPHLMVFEYTAGRFKRSFVP